MLHIFHVFSANITAAVLDNLSSNQVVFGWQGVLGCSPNQVLHFARYGEVPNSLPQRFQPRNIRLTRLCILVLSLQELIPRFNVVSYQPLVVSWCHSLRNNSVQIKQAFQRKPLSFLSSQSLCIPHSQLLAACRWLSISVFNGF